jgi:hypothetical protein
VGLTALFGMGRGVSPPFSYQHFNDQVTKLKS